MITITRGIDGQECDIQVIEKLFERKSELKEYLKKKAIVRNPKINM